MADSNVTESKITDNAVANDEATKPAAAAPSPAAMKAHAPSPAVLAKSPVAHPASSSSHDDVELKEAESFGRVDDNGTVYVKEGEGEREVGQFLTRRQTRRWPCTRDVTSISRPNSTCSQTDSSPTRSSPVKSTRRSPR